MAPPDPSCRQTSNPFQHELHVILDRAHRIDLHVGDREGWKLDLHTLDMVPTDLVPSGDVPLPAGEPTPVKPDVTAHTPRSPAPSRAMR